MSTIVALSTPIGRGAIAIVRLSGQLSLQIAQGLSRGLELVKARRPTLARLYYSDNDEILDEVLITYFPAPNSVTGEDVVEISCHGSPTIVREILDQSLLLGARLAEPGEFTLRALANGKINLTQAEAIRDLIAAQTSAAAKQASRQIEGELSQRLAVFKDSLVKVIVVLESALEFVEDDLPVTEARELEDSLSFVFRGVRDLADSYKAGRFLQEGIKVAIVGSPNVGKSSLFNRLLEQDRAIVTHIPGTTRDTLTQSIDIQGIPVILTDTAGLRETRDSLESLGIERTRRAIAEADLLLEVIDATAEHSESVRDNDKPTLLVINKIDLEPRETQDLPEAIRVSAMTGEGLNHLRTAIIQALSHGNLQAEGLIITNARHHDLLKLVVREIELARSLLKDRTSEELVVVPLHNALKLLGQITGETTTEEILSLVFATFCIGK